MTGNPKYYTPKSLAAAAGVSPRTFRSHLASDTGQLSKAREMVPGLGLRYLGSKCEKYIALCHADPRRKARAEGRIAVRDDD